MLIRRIKLNNFMSHKASEIDLPEKGVVVITGPNGSGKSSLAESIATGIWGKTLRGSSPWVADQKGKVELQASIDGEKFIFNRSASKGGKASASFEPSPSSYSTVSKTQKAIDEVAGNFDTWRKCSVFSSQDAAHFTLATDAERKRLLESLLGLDKFDTALKTCRDGQKEISAKIRNCENDLLTNTTKTEMRQQSSFDAQAQLAQAKSKAAIEGYSEEELTRLEALLSSQREAHVSVYGDSSLCREKIYRLKSQKTHLERELDLFANDLCPTCEQPLHSKNALKTKKKKEADLASVSTELTSAESTYASLREEEEHLAKQVRKTEASLNKQLSFRDMGQGSIIRHLEKTIGKTTEELARLSEEKKSLGKKLAELQYDLALNENIQTVLGTKGVRAHILTSALSALEVTSNKWLRKIAPKTARIDIKPYVQNKTGGTRDAIALSISGLGNGEGYKSLSGGQRRRVDVALLLGLAELAQASNQKAKGTVFFDEVFDSLDAEGIAAVSNVIEEMSSDRSIVIISHSGAVVDSLHAVKHLHIQDGKVTEV